MSGVVQPTDDMRFARRLVESLPAVELLEDLTWFEVVHAWGMLCQITCEFASSHVPPKTDWWVTMDPTYPFGKVTFYPAKRNGLGSTFPHQANNSREHSEAPWRTGEICIRSPVFTFGKQVLDPDPIGDRTRLAWYFDRAQKWLRQAASGNLLAQGDPFELPAFPIRTARPYRLAHCESEATFTRWKNSPHRYGKAELIAVGPTDSRVVAVRRFFNHRGEELLGYHWGTAIAKSTKVVEPAVWLYCESMPVLEPYEAIGNWGDLFHYLRGEGSEDLFKRSLDFIRNGETHLLLIGFPIPIRVGDMPRQVHWQPIRLPVISYGTKFAPGFRPNSMGYWMRDRTMSFPMTGNPDWQESENWSSKETTTRGRLADSLANKSLLVIGAGAIGAVVSEMLVRAGCRSVAICDSGAIEHGNLCRHVLRMGDIGRNKAEAMTTRLLTAQGHADIRFIPRNFPFEDTADKDLVRASDIILDCTGEDSALLSLANYDWERARWFCSISLSYKAARIYVFTAQSTTFPLVTFQTQVESWLLKDLDKASADELPQSGVGCWHPAFPARIDDVWMLAAAAVRRLEEAVVASDSEPKLVVYEQVVDNGSFQGIKRV